MSSFTMTLPPGWRRLDLSGDIDNAIEAFVSAIVRRATPTLQPRVRRLATEHVVPRLRAFADAGVHSMILPLPSGSGDAIEPVITMTSPDLQGKVDPLLMLQALVADDSTATLVDLSGLVAVRTHATVDATDAAGEAQPLFDDLVADPEVPKIEVDIDQLDLPADLRLVSSRVRYTLGDPDDRDKWMDVQMAVDHPTTTEAEQLTQDTIELFDAVMSTFRWES